MLNNGEWLSSSVAIPPIIQLPRLLHASRKVAQEEEGSEELKLLLDAGSGSLGGARPKASIFDEGKLYLAKFSHPSDTWDVMAWEKTALDIARLAGIDVPKARLTRIGSEQVLLLERFDRESVGEHEIRLPYVSAMTLLDARVGDSRDYAELAEALGFFVSDATADLASLFRRIVLLIALHSTDDHLRNHGFIRTSGGWKLSPLFDVNPNPFVDYHRVTAIFGESGSREADSLTDLSASFGLLQAAAEKEVSEVIKAVKQWRAVARSNGCRKAEMSLFEPVFLNRIEALREAFRI